MSFERLTKDDVVKIVSKIDELLNSIRIG
jgi:hypothetical protein